MASGQLRVAALCQVADGPGPGSLGRDEAAAQREAGHGLRVVKPQLAHHARAVRVHGLGREPEVDRHLPVGLPLRDQLQDLALARREALQIVDGAVPPARSRLLEEIRSDDALRLGAVEVAAARDGAQRAEQVLQAAALDDVAAGPGAQGRAHELGRAVHRQHQHAAARRGSAQPADGLAAVATGHREIEQDYVGLEHRGLADGVEAVAGLTDHLDVGLAGQEHPQPGAHDRVIIAEQDPNHRPNRSTRAAKSRIG